MSSVGGSDSNRGSDNENVRRKFEDARQRESELVKRQQKEIRRLNEQHYAEVERLKDDHNLQMQELQKGSRDAISARDHQYQQEIEDVRNLHRRQLQSQAEDNQKRDEVLRKAVKTDQASQQKTSDDRYEQLSHDYREKLLAQEESFRTSLGEGREAQAKAIADNRDRLEKAHEIETDQIRQERAETVRKMQKEMDDYRGYVTRERVDHDAQDFRKRVQGEKGLIEAVRRERAARVDSEDELRTGFRDGLADVRDRYGRAMKEKSEQMEQGGFELKHGTIARMDDQVRRLEADNNRMKDDNARAQVKLKREMKRELNNYRDAFKKNMDNFQDQRDEAVRQSNDQNHRDVGKLRADLEDQMLESNRYYRGQMDEQNRIFRTAYDRLKGDYESRQDQLKDTADGRIKHLMEVTESEKARMIELSNENHKAGQRLKADQMKALRDAMDNDKQEAINRLQDYVRKQELQHAERMNLVVSKYEKQVQDLKDQLVRESKQNDENMKRLTDEMGRLHKMELDQVDAKNRERMRQLNTQHGNELRTVNRRHEEKLDQVISEMKKT